jgi:RecA/RadA recombinase
MMTNRQRFGIAELDQLLGGGLVPGTLTVIAGATGAGKTQLGLRWAGHGNAEEGRRGVVCDLTSRGDDQHHAGYAQSQLHWELKAFARNCPPDLGAVWDDNRPPGDYFNPFGHTGRRVGRRDLDPETWHAWKTELARILRVSAAFFYAHFIRGARRVMVDGIEPIERFSESIQFEFFDYVYHHILRKEDDWAARELFRERFRAEEAQVLAHRYDHTSIGCVCVYTTPHVLLDELMAQPIGEGDIFSNANTVIYMGRTREPGGMRRALYVAKHRGSSCGEEVMPYRLGPRGLEFGGH